jgi:hypothetical protein
MLQKLLLLMANVVLSSSILGQANLLLNPDASDPSAHWKANRDAEVRDSSGESIFVVRNGGYFYQDVKLPTNSDGKYALLIGKASAQRINPDNSITDSPYIFGYMIYDYKPAGSKINTYLQGQRMLLQGTSKDEWSNLYGVFKVATGTEVVRFFLNQASRRGDPHDGSEARFDNLGLYLFDAESEAIRFAESY